MIIDSQARFDWDDALTATRNSTNAYDLGAALRDVGQADNDLWLVGQVGTALTSGGSSTLTATLIQSTAAGLGSPDTLMTLMPSTAKATLVAGYTMFRLRLPLGLITKRYLGITWTVGTADFTGGTVKAFFTPNVDAQVYLPKGYVNY